MYSSCINTTAVEQFGDSELRALLVELADFNMTKNRSNTSYDWQTFVVKIKRRLNMDAFFRLQVLDDLRNSSLKRIAVSMQYYRGEARAGTLGVPMYIFCYIIFLPAQLEVTAHLCHFEMRPIFFIPCRCVLFSCL